MTLESSEVTIQHFKMLYRFVQDFGSRDSQEGYSSECDLCLDIRKFLVSRAQFEELQTKAFYEQLALPETRQKQLS